MKNFFLLAATVSLSLSSATTRKRPVFGKFEDKRLELKNIADSFQKNHISSREKPNSHAKASSSSSSSDGTVFYFPNYAGGEQTCSSDDEYLYTGDISLII